MNRKYVLEVTLPLLNFTFINYFSDADTEIFDWIRKSFNAKLMAGTFTTVDEWCLFLHLFENKITDTVCHWILDHSAERLHRTKREGY